MSEADEAHATWVERCAEYRKSIVCVKAHGSVGTGWIAATGPEAFVVATANHVIEAAVGHATPISIASEDGSFPEQVYDPGEGRSVIHTGYDLSLLFFYGPPPGPRLLLHHPPETRDEFAWVERPPLGISVGWLGFPITSIRAFGRPTPTFCRGHLSAIGERNGTTYYLIDGNVNPGMSGAPVWDEFGRVLGMVLEYHGPPVEERSLAFPGYGLILPIGFLMTGLRTMGAK